MEPIEIVEFEKVEKANINNPSVIQELEQELENLLNESKVTNDYPQWLLYRNLFRVRNAQHLRIKKPKIFLGMIGFSDYPNFQTWPFLTFCDLISICIPAYYNGRADRISYDFKNEVFMDLVKKIPKHFKPDYFWDPQICGVSIPPYGLEEAPFPTIAGICHTFRGPHAEAIANYYDYVTPISTPFCDIFSRSSVSARTLDIPVGGNWGSFNITTATDTSSKRTIDVLVNFSPSINPEYKDYRKRAHALLQNFKDNHGDEFNVVFEFGVNKNQYMDSMKNARVVINACGYNGPYNYRSFEAMNCGALLMQIRTNFDVPQDLNQYFKESEDYLDFDESDFEQKLLDVLRNEAKRAAIASSGVQKLDSNYSYEVIQTTLHRKITCENSENIKRKDHYASLLAWMNILSTAPVHYRPKKELFARIAIDSGTADSLSIRYTLMALTILANTELGSSYISDIELRMKFEESVFEAIHTVYQLLPEQERNVLDRWFFLCLQSIHGVKDVSALKMLHQELSQDHIAEKLDLDATAQVLLDLDLSNGEFVELKKFHYDEPTMTYLDDSSKRKKLLQQYLLVSLMFFIEASD